MNGRNFEGLTDAEQRAFEALAVNLGEGHPPKVVAALLEKGFVAQREGTHGPMRVVHVDRLYVPFDVHRRWCEWCEENYDERGKRRRKPSEPPAPVLDREAALGPLPGLEGA